MEVSQPGEWDTSDRAPKACSVEANPSDAKPHAEDEGRAGNVK